MVHRKQFFVPPTGHRSGLFRDSYPYHRPERIACLRLAPVPWNRPCALRQDQVAGLPATASFQKADYTANDTGSVNTVALQGDLSVT